MNGGGGGRCSDAHCDKGLVSLVFKEEKDHKARKQNKRQKNETIHRESLLSLLFPSPVAGSCTPAAQNMDRIAKISLLAMLLT